jgi:hypothetical protein
MIRRTHNGVEWLEFELLSDIPELRHGVFLRHGGFSTGAYESLNLSYTVGDDRINVVKNHEKVATILGTGCIVSGNHVHGKAIAEVPSTENLAVTDCDGLMTDLPGIALRCTHADCQAAIFYDPIEKALANIHCGWRGNVQNIYQETIEKMGKRYGSKPGNILVGISPSLGPDHAEFVHYKTEFPKSFWSYQLKPNYFDLWMISRKQLEDAGILPHHIEIANICTYTHANDYFSHRRSRPRGGNGTFVCKAY